MDKPIIILNNNNNINLKTKCLLKLKYVLIYKSVTVKLDWHADLHILKMNFVQNQI